MESNSLSHGNIGSGSVPIPIDLRVVCSIVGALALFAPFLVTIDLRWGGLELWAMTWIYYVPYGFADLGYIHYMAMIPWTVWRVVFVYQMVRYYQGRSSRRVTVLLGILAEIPILVVLGILPLLFPSATFGAFLTIPTPLMLVGASVFMWMTPFPVPKTPFDHQAEPDRWWQEGVDFPVGQPIEPRRWEGLIHAESRLKCPRCGSEEIGREMHPGSFGIRARFVYSCKKCRAQWER